MGETPPPRIALAACREHPEGTGGETKLPDLLAERGARAEWAVWDDASVDWDAYDLVAVRSTSDYPEHLAAFTAWVRQVALSSELVNSAKVITGHLHKGYLAGLGPDAVPSVVVPVGMTIDFDRLGWSAAVVKPAVAVGGTGAIRDATQADLDGLTLRDEGIDAIVQPCLPGITSDGSAGETSVLVIDGMATHAVTRAPATGELGAPEHRGGPAELAELTPAVVEVVRRVLARLPTLPVVARIDILHDGDRPLVSEVELVEPYLWLELAPDAAERLADVLVRRARVGQAAL